MKTLKEFILEAEGTATKFDNWTSTFDDLLDKCPTLIAKRNIDAVKELIDDIITTANYKPEELFIYASKGSYFKIPYAFTETMQLFINNEKYKDLFKIQKITANKIRCSFVKGGIVFETGSGSLGRVSTEQQETATCVVWNAYVDAMKNNMNFDTNDSNFIKELVAELSDNFDSEWISTFGKQVVAITDYIKKIGGRPLEYKMCRYGESASKDEVSNAHHKFVSRYISEMQAQKDNFDPSDVLIYHEPSKSTIISLLNEYAKDPIKSKERFFNEVFSTKLLQGISLKKIAGNKTGKYSQYNTDQNHTRIGDVNSFEIIKKRTSDHQLIIECKGNFKFDDITDSSGDEVGNEKSVLLKLRTFGDDRPGLECCINENKAPSLGKCPVRLWKRIFYINDNDNINTCVSKCVEFIEKYDEKLIRDRLKIIIASAVKEGPACFPFVLLH